MSFRDRNLGEREEAGFAIGIVLAGQAASGECDKERADALCSAPPSASLDGEAGEKRRPFYIPEATQDSPPRREASGNCVP